MKNKLNGLNLEEEIEDTEEMGQFDENLPDLKVDNSLQKAKIAYHDHEGQMPLHPVRVKDHQEYFQQRGGLKEAAAPIVKKPWQMTRAERATDIAQQGSMVVDKWNKSGARGFPPSNPAKWSIYDFIKVGERLGYKPRSPEMINLPSIPQHKLEVMLALFEGEPVPSHVLADYPDLIVREKDIMKSEDNYPDPASFEIYKWIDNQIIFKDYSIETQTDGKVILRLIR